MVPITIMKHILMEKHWDKLWRKSGMSSNSARIQYWNSHYKPLYNLEYDEPFEAPWGIIKGNEKNITMFLLTL